MKTITHNQHLKEECQNSGRLLLRSVSSLRLVRLPLRLPVQRLLTTVIPGCRATSNNIKVAFDQAASNKRIVFGGVVMAVGFVLYQAHRLFINPEIYSPIAFMQDPGPVGYYHSLFDWLFTNREEFLFGFGLTGFFLMCPTGKWGYKYLLVTFITACFTEVVYQSFFITNWNDFYRTPTWEILTVLTPFTYAVFRFGVYQIYLYYHPVARNWASVKGIIKVPGIPADEKIQHLNLLVIEAENLNAKY
jgi:hypothetical protein